MRDKVSVFYYPDSFAELPTLKKAVLLFDEIHLIDRPSFMFNNFGTIAADSPLRPYEKPLRDEGVGFYIHKVSYGYLHGEFLEQITADVNDLEFLRRFQHGLSASETFRNLQIAHGNYGEVGDHNAVAAKLLGVNLAADLPNECKPMELVMNNEAAKPFDYVSRIGCTKALLSEAAICSAKLNVALNVAQKNGIIPLADAAPYGDLLGAKYKRAMDLLVDQSDKCKPELTDLSFAVFDEFVPAERLARLSLKDVIRYKREAGNAREAFLEQLAALHAKQQGMSGEGNYQEALKSVIIGDVLPAAREFKNKLATIYDNLFGSLASGTLSYLGTSAALKIFGDISWQNLLRLAGIAGAALGKAALDARTAIKIAKRECALSYVIDLGNRA